MKVEWDPAKAKSNFRKHGIPLADAVAALEDEQAITVADERDLEERWVTLGMDALARVLVVVYTWREDAVRLISARQATASEREIYEEER
ncbi:MAG: BrnT family toxin [Acidobacteriota bacterium]